MTSLTSTIDELNEYLKIAEKKADTEMSKLRSKVERKFRDTEKRLELVREVGAAFKEESDNLEGGVMDKYSNKIFEVVDSTINSIKRPEKFDLKSLNEYADNSRDALLAQDEVLIKYVKLLKGPKFKRRVKSLSKSLQKLNKDLTKLERFITDEYAPYSDVENTTVIIEDSIAELEDFDAIYLEIMEKEDEVMAKDVEITRLISELNDLNNHPSRVKYQQALAKYSETQKSIDNDFSNIRKALRKYENMISKSKNKGDTALLKDLIKDASNCLAAQNSLGSVERLLSDINEQLEKNNLKLKKDKRELAKQDIARLLEGDLNKFWEDAKESIRVKLETANELTELDLESKIHKLESSILGTTRDRNRMTEREIRILNKIIVDIEKSNAEINERLGDQLENELNLLDRLHTLPNWAVLKE